MSELGKLSQEQNFKGWKEWGYIYIYIYIIECILKLYWYLYCIIIKGISKKKNLCPCCYYKGNFTQ